MSPAKVIVIRASVVATLLLAMPLVVLPPVVAQIDALFYRADPASLPLVEKPVRSTDAPQRPTQELAGIKAVQESENADEDLDRRLAAAQYRLQALGASLLVLEAADAETKEFHFQCRMPLDDEEMEFEAFHATSSHPAIAMEQVVREVESWRGTVETAQLPHEAKRLR